jgi:hypothetical protein
MQTLLYTFVGYTDVLEEEEEGSESEPEGQDIDELYHFVKQTHQQETRSVQVDVQHPALIPVLRPYQREAVNWMLQQEQFRSAPPAGKYKMLKEGLIRRDVLQIVNSGACIGVTASNHTERRIIFCLSE